MVAALVERAHRMLDTDPLTGAATTV
jgi:hypothetical protein